MVTPDLSLPAATPPPGVTANFDNPPNQAVVAYSTLIASLVLVTFFTWFRFLVKLCIVKTLHLEDYLLPFAWISAIGFVAPSFIVYSFAPITHTWDMQLRTLSHFLLYFRLGSIFYNISILLIKLSLLIQVLRIFVPRGAQSRTYYLIQSLICICTLYYLTTICLMMFTCRPIDKAWKPWKQGKCLEVGVIAMVVAAMNLASDLAILVLSQWVIWNIIKVDARMRAKLTVVFCAGAVPCAFAVLCLIYNDRMLRSNDFAYDAAIMSLACHGEITSGMFVLFLSVLPSFFSHMKKRISFLGSRHGRAPSRLEFSDVGVPGQAGAVGGGRREMGGAVGNEERSLWHISYTQRGGEDGQGEAFWKERDLDGDVEGDGGASLSRSLSAGSAGSTLPLSVYYSSDKV